MIVNGSAATDAYREILDRAETGRLIDLVDSTIEAWSEGQPVDASGLLKRHPELLEHEPLVMELAGEEYRLRSLRGEKIDVGEFCRKYSVLGENVRRILEFKSALAASMIESRNDELWPAEDDHFLNFHLVSEIGRGAFSRVFLARESDVGGREVVVKLTSGPSDEAATSGRLVHPHIVRVYSVDNCDLWNVHSICMEYAGSRTLRDLVRYVRMVGKTPEHGVVIDQIAQEVKRTAVQDGDTVVAKGSTTKLATADNEQPLVEPVFDERSAAHNSLSHQGPRDERQGNVVRYPTAVARLIAECARALEYTHGQGVLHMDVKPSNVLLTKDGHAKLLDFNLSRDANFDRVTMGGTIPYMSAEQIRCLFLDDFSQPVDARSDLFSLGVILFELLCGQRPWEDRWSGDTSLDARNRLAALHRPHRSLQSLAPMISDSLVWIIDKAIALDPADRFQHAGEFAEALEEWVASQASMPETPPTAAAPVPPRSRRRRYAGFAAVVVGGLIGIWFFSPFFHGRKQRTLDDVLREAGAMMEAGDSRQALEEMYALRKTYGTNPRYLAALGTLHFAAGERLAAGRPFSSAIRHAREDQLADLTHDVGYCLWAREQRAEAIKYWKRALELDPHNPYVRMSLAKATAECRYRDIQVAGLPDLARAVRMANDVAADYPRNSHMNYFAGLVNTVAFLDNGDPELQAQAEYFLMTALATGHSPRLVNGVLGFHRVPWSDELSAALLAAEDERVATDKASIARAAAAQLATAKYLVDVAKK